MAASLSAWCQVDPLLTEAMDKVWLWSEFPARTEFGSKLGEWNKTKIIFIAYIQLSYIPMQANDYVDNGRSAVELVMKSYRVKNDMDSGTANDLNNWAKEHNKPRYILDLVL